MRGPRVGLLLLCLLGARSFRNEHPQQPQPPLPLLRLRGGLNWKHEWRSERNRESSLGANYAGTQVAQTPSLKQWNGRRSLIYLEVLGIVLLWVATGTLFYSHHNGWPLAQSFFYAVDAGMSIGFCTDVREKLISSRAFTIVYILLGASVVGGALALFVEDTMESVLEASTRGYRRLLAMEAFLRSDSDKDGSISYSDFGVLIGWRRGADGGPVERRSFERLCRRFDPMSTGIRRGPVNDLAILPSSPSALCTSPFYPLLPALSAHRASLSARARARSIAVLGRWHSLRRVPQGLAGESRPAWAADADFTLHLGEPRSLGLRLVALHGDSVGAVQAEMGLGDRNSFRRLCSRHRWSDCPPSQCTGHPPCG